LGRVRRSPPQIVRGRRHVRPRRISHPAMMPNSRSSARRWQHTSTASA
jgi:hypothetical protein